MMEIAWRIVKSNSGIYGLPVESRKPTEAREPETRRGREKGETSCQSIIMHGRESPDAMYIVIGVSMSYR